MTQYLYPQNLKATANLWLWGLRDFCILGIAALLSIVTLVQLGFFLPAAATLCFGFLTIRMDDTTVLDFIKYAVRYFISTQQYYEFRTTASSPLRAALRPPVKRRRSSPRRLAPARS